MHRVCVLVVLFVGCVAGSSAGPIEDVKGADEDSVCATIDVVADCISAGSCGLCDFRCVAGTDDGPASGESCGTWLGPRDECDSYDNDSDGSVDEDVDTFISFDHCGACDVSCTLGQSCSDGSCYDLPAGSQNARCYDDGSCEAGLVCDYEQGDQLGVCVTDRPGYQCLANKDLCIPR